MMICVRVELVVVQQLVLHWQTQAGLLREGGGCRVAEVSWNSPPHQLIRLLLAHPPTNTALTQPQPSPY